MGNKSKAAAIFFALMLIGVVAFCFHGTELRSVLSNGNEYGLVLDSSNQPHVEDGNAVQKIRYVDIMYSNVQDSSSGHVVLDSDGLIANEVMIHGISSINVVFEPVGNAWLALFHGDNCLPLTNHTPLASGTMNTDIFGSSYFVIQAQEGRVEIQSLLVSYSCIGSEENPSLPKVHITTSIDDHGNHRTIDSRVNYTNSTLHIDDVVDKQYAIAEEDALECQIKIRGNSTSAKPKKPYRIKLEKKRGLFGYAKAKNYVLLAEYMDGSALHNYSVLSFANKIPGFSFTPTPKHVEVYINGIYNGLYVFAEHVEAKEGRLEIEQDITPEMLPQDINIMFEMDESVANDPTETLDQTYFSYQYSESKTMYYTLKYPEIDECSSEEQYYAVFDYLKQYVDDTWRLFKEGTVEDLTNGVDIDSLTAFALVDTIFNESDHAAKSFKMYRLASDGKLYFGPIWDYDSCSFSLPYLGYPVSNPFAQCHPNAFELIAFRNDYFKHFVNRFSGLAQMKVLYNDYGSISLGEIEAMVQNQTTYISHNLVRNAKLWFDGDIKMVFENLKYTNAYLHQRKVYLDIYFS